ncbi:hypothetical protein H8L32_11450 [Undibacterium sp. CY18W]|uniref:DUF805 domain-containing protein n=1 Tax=Undibacterium hunanense TaxID=2762292 RepID=A0ABR6ZQE4_9BURK|nr:hypothetical protein [Undibacterium hunanense]MBC3918094.1 hypothetical protein [Undibacterium hunanense]
MTTAPLAEQALLRARLYFVLTFVALFGGAFLFSLNPIFGYIGVSGYFFSLVATHVFLGKAAQRSGRSWVYYGFLPFVFPMLGAFLSFCVLRSKIPHSNTEGE